MGDKAIESELLNLERQYWQSMKDTDAEKASRLTDYKVKEKLTVEDKLVTLEAADASVWVKRDGKWLRTLHTESVAGDPFGRDRQTAH